MIPYERPTDELRQVQHRSLLWSGDWYTFFIVQRKWLIYAKATDAMSAQWETPTEEWRNIPIVSAGEIK